MIFESKALSKGYIERNEYQDIVFEFQNRELEIFENVQADHISVEKSSFRKCTFKNIIVNDGFDFATGRGESVYADCIFENVSFNSGSFGFSKFVSCIFSNVKFKDCFGFNSSFVGCKFEGLFEKVVFIAKPIESNSRKKSSLNEITNNDFSGAKLVGCAFRRGVNLNDQILPNFDGSYLLNNARESIHSARDSIRFIQDENLRKKLMLELDILDDETAEGQEQLYLTLSDYPKNERSDILLLFEKHLRCKSLY